MDTIDEHAQETIHEHGHRNRYVAVLIASLAAALAITEMQEKQELTGYLTHHIAVSDDWAFYQAKNVRASISASQASILSNLPTAATPDTQAEIKRVKDTEARYRDEPGHDGMKQLAERAAVHEIERDHAFHSYHMYEYVVGILQIAIVLASVSVVISVPALAYGAGAIGGLATLFGIFLWADLVSPL